ncbi:MAG: Gfo/Idh/MocA family oxidoreductase [Candidatus Poribacteria bacterium]|nr:Gfo/Idh/MocA family oxidoreductase [Candidatus Poribacteria bacterium]
MPLRVGFLGTGAWSRGHLYQVQQQPDTVVTACFGTNPTKTASFKDEAGDSCVVYENYREMLRHIDALYVVIPPFAHETQIRDAIEAGVHVFTEKPIARTLEDAKRTAEVAEARTDVKTQIGYMLRFTQAANVIGDFVHRRGTPILMTGRYFCNDLHAHWWRDHDKSGGQLLEQVIHLIDFAGSYFGEPTEVYCVADNLAHRAVEGYTTDDVSVLTARFDSGAVATFAATNQAVPNRWEMAYHLVFENLTVESDDLHAARFRVTEPGAEESFDLNNSPTPYEAETVDFLSAIRENRPTRCPVQEGVKALRIIDAAERSRASGNPARL